VDQGKTVTGYCHVVGLNAGDGLSNVTNAGASCAGSMYGVADECPTSACDCTVTVSALGIVTGTGKNIWTQATPLPLTCTAVSDPTYCSGSGGKFPCSGGGGSGGGCQPPEGGCPDGEAWNAEECTCESGQSSPIVVDTTGAGFSLTSAENGVMFDFWGNGRPVQISWTSATSGNAFLALDRNHNGVIDSGKDLFGNITEQPSSQAPNGFLALAEFDTPENGGNGDGNIDSRDAIFSHLLLWIDANHDGISQPNELHTLPELGVYSLALNYTDSRRTDQFGNQFRYKAAVNPDPQDGESRDGRWTYDVFLRVLGKQAQNPSERDRTAISAADHTLGPPGH